MRPAGATGNANEKATRGGLLHFLAERTGLAYIPQAADARARASLRVPPEAAQAASSTPQSRARKRAQPETQMKKPARGGLFHFLAERTGLEPATPGVTGRYSNRLNYRSSFLTLTCRTSVTFLQALRHFYETPLNLASPRGFEPLYSP